jgi:hypothetical protein
MKKITLTFFAISTAFMAYSQDIISGLDAPAYGVRIKVNFPGLTSAYARGYYIANQDNSTNFLGFGVMGEINNGVSTMNYGWIGKDYNETYTSFLQNGNVGIGTNAPASRLEVTSGANYNQLSLTKNTLEGDKGAGIVFKNAVNDGSIPEIAGIQAKLLHGGTGLVAGSLNFYTKYNSAKVEAVTINPQGDMGIGTASPREKLSVNGKICAHEIKVETSNWPDYVFEDGYDVGTLEKLEGYIKTNKHLPEMPSAKEVAVNGVELGEMNKLLLKKVEELTLHLIDKDKELQNSNKRLLKVETKQKEMETLLKKLTANK